MDYERCRRLYMYIICDESAVSCQRVSVCVSSWIEMSYGVDPERPNSHKQQPTINDYLQ